jgi:hypothetical protein
MIRPIAGASLRAAGRNVTVMELSLPRRPRSVASAPALTNKQQRRNLGYPAAPAWVAKLPDVFCDIAGIANPIAPASTAQAKHGLRDMLIRLPE